MTNFEYTSEKVLARGFPRIIGPYWIVAGRRPRAIPVFRLRIISLPHSLTEGPCGKAGIIPACIIGGNR
jgi:hypothetical protein